MTAVATAVCMNKVGGNDGTNGGGHWFKSGTRDKTEKEHCAPFLFTKKPSIWII